MCGINDPVTGLVPFAMRGYDPERPPGGSLSAAIQFQHVVGRGTCLLEEAGV